ncbi:MSMEG_0570 family nitrogen starvation response protein [Bradyrhizobium canariense]|uniref:MSMEG_0570 family protein n=1 Tax=Bradyrhizobium canariense TaxID=255045 RepID=A0A1H2APE4_9BRAD|nr:MSMEG_0570 family nitrogen starvation response protein [Bradyrhizobium canariense]SDT47800.1 MSMEG_0570 family protein [Bradyrhizobium canariense]
MPEMLFQIRWPDGATEQCYSPSLVIKDHLEVGTTYDVAEFMRRSRTALMIASDRVREKYGFACSRAMGQLAKLEASAQRFEASSNAGVTITSFHE